MENQLESKKIDAVKNAEKKIKIVKVFDEMINQVDIDAETILFRINNNSVLKQPIQEEINKSRKLIIDEINKIKNENLNASYQTGNPEDLIQDNLFTKHCVYLDSDTVESFTFNKDRLGILLVTDFYISGSQLNKFNEIISSVLKKNIVEWEESKDVIINKYFIENIFILKQLKSKLYNDQCIMNFSSQMFHEIDEIELNLGSYINTITTDRLDRILDRFTGLKALNIKGYLDFDKTLTISYLQKFDQFYCKKTKIENFQFEAFKSLRVLELQFNNIDTLSPQAFHNLPFLEKLDISHNELEELPDNIFSQLSNLKSLILTDNPIKIIKKATFNGLYNLENFCFAYLNRAVFEKNVFEGLDNLRNIEIKQVNSSLKDLCFEVDLPRNLERAAFRFEYAYTWFINWLNSANNLKILDLRFMKREKLNNSYFNNCHELEVLVLFDVDLAIDNFPSNLNNLKKIYLNNVRFQNNKENLFLNSKQIDDTDSDLRTGSLSVNQQDLKFLCEPKNIEIIKLSYSGIENMCNELFNGLANLKNLDLSTNNLNHISENAFSNGMKNLVELDLSENRLKSISNEMLENLVSLEKLNLYHNKIDRIEKNSFKCLSNLKYLNLSRNSLKKLDNGIFQDLVNLEDINLSDNEIKNIDSLFDNNLKLKYLCLRSNEIESDDFKSLAKLVNLEHLNLRDNQTKNIDIEDINYFMYGTAKKRVYLESDHFPEHTKLHDFFEKFNFK